MKTLSKMLRIPISIGLVVMAGSVLADDSSEIAVGITAQDQALIDQLTTCVNAAVGQGMSTVEGIENHCNREVSQLETLLSGLPKIIIESALH